MNEIQRYQPSFFEASETMETAEFDTLEQLMMIPWVLNFAKRPDFHQYSVSAYELMAEYQNGKEWWVVGFLKNTDVGLPQWTPKGQHE